MTEHTVRHCKQKLFLTYVLVQLSEQQTIMISKTWFPQQLIIQILYTFYFLAFVFLFVWKVSWCCMFNFQSFFAMKGFFSGMSFLDEFILIPMSSFRKNLKSKFKAVQYLSLVPLLQCDGTSHSLRAQHTEPFDQNQDCIIRLAYKALSIESLTNYKYILSSVKNSIVLFKAYYQSFSIKFLLYNLWKTFIMEPKRGYHKTITF